MRPDIKERWLAALRGGSYKQGQRGLKMGDRYCCLGVLCDITCIGKWRSGVYNYYEVGVDKRCCIPHDEVLIECGLPGGAVEKLISMNDADDKSFCEIADWVEANL